MQQSMRFSPRLRKYTGDDNLYQDNKIYQR